MRTSARPYLRSNVSIRQASLPYPGSFGCDVCVSLHVACSISLLVRQQIFSNASSFCHVAWGVRSGLAGKVPFVNAISAQAPVARCVYADGRDERCLEFVYRSCRGSLQNPH